MNISVRGTPEDFKSLWDEGRLTQKQIGEQLRRGKYWIEKWKREFGLVRPEEYWENVAPQARNRHNSCWTDEKVAELRAACLVVPPMSSRQIGELLGVPRNAVIGKCHRLKIQLPVLKTVGAPKASRPKRREKKKEQVIGPTGIKKQKYTEIPELETFNGAIPLEQRRDIFSLTPESCRFPVGDPGAPEFFYCGAAVWQEKRPYCETHHFYCHQETLPPKSHPWIERRRNVPA